MDDPPNWNLLVVFILGFFLDAQVVELRMSDVPDTIRVVR